ncbi:unnamed protein product [Ectocarpus sp. 4 AP-2014]
MEGVCGPATNDESANASETASTGSECNVHPGSDRRSAVTPDPTPNEMSLRSTLAESVLRPEVDTRAGIPAAASNVSATQSHLSSPTPEAPPRSERWPLGKIVVDSRTVRNLCSADGPTSQQESKPREVSGASLTVSMSTSHSSVSRDDLSCVRVASAQDQQIAKRSEQASAAYSEVPKTSIEPGINSAAADRSGDTTGADGGACFQNGHNEADDESTRCIRQQSSYAEEAVRPNKDTKPAWVASAPRREDTAPDFGRGERRGTSGRGSHSAPLYEGGIGRRARSPGVVEQASALASSALPSSALPDGKAGTTPQRIAVRFVGAAEALGGFGSVADSQPTRAMTTADNNQQLNAGAGLEDRAQMGSVGEHRGPTVPAVNRVEMVVSAVREEQGAGDFSTNSQPALPISRDFAGDGGCQASSSTARTTGGAGVVRTENASRVPGGRKPSQVLPTPRRPSPHPTFSSNGITSSGPHSPWDESDDVPSAGCVEVSSAEQRAPISKSERDRRPEEELSASASSGESAECDSAGDMADVALAAFSYANAVAEAGGEGDPASSVLAGLENERVWEQTQPVSDGVGEGSSRSAALETHATAAKMAEDIAISPGPSRECAQDRTASATSAVISSVTTQLTSRALLNGEAASESTTLLAGGTTGACGPTGVTTAASRQKRAGAIDRHDDMMHAMCMICLEKLSDAAEGGGAKLLGLLDACSHRYCYTCILEWSKITNKCPQCKARFHTVKAVQELRRTNERYRGVAVRVEDRDQVYSFVDVRDVVVLDPEVACHVGCLVRRGVDAIQQGWEFSVQCEQCSTWYHGLCVGFRQESEIPDLWICRPCRGESYQITLDPDAITEPTAIVARGRTSSGSNHGSTRGRRASPPSASHDGLPPSVSGQEGSEPGEVVSSLGQVPEQVDSFGDAHRISRSVSDGGQGIATRSDQGRAMPNIPAQDQVSVNLPALAPQSRVQSPSSSQPPGAPAEERDNATSSGSSTSPLSDRPLSERMAALFSSQPQALATPLPSVFPTRPPEPVRATSAPTLTTPGAASPPRGRGRPRGSRNMPESSRPQSAQALTSPQEQAHASPTPLASTAARASSASPLPPPGAAAPRGKRGRSRGSKNKQPAQPAAQQAVQPAMQPAVPSTVLPAVRPTAVQPVAQPTVEPPTPPPTPPTSESHVQRSFAPRSEEPPRSRSQTDHRQQHTPLSTIVSLVGDGAGSEDIPARPPKPPAPSLLRSLEAPEVNDLCEICGFDTEPDNLIVYCESCNMGVHQTCYGISEIPTKEWYCSPCSAGVHPSTLACRFCPNRGGALKRCTDGSWGHILCAFWIPECCFLDPQKMEPIGSINRRGQAGGVEKFLPSFRSRKCHVCGTSGGSAIRCHSASCKFHLHPMCGSKAGSVYMEIETTMKRGVDGTEHESVNLVAKCPRHNKSKVYGRAGKGRSAVASAADPLSVMGKTIEITDPERDGAVALVGKVTWFDPNRSRYCIVTSRRVGGDGDSCDSGEPKEGRTHWIAAKKLVEAKAVGLHKNGKTFALEPLPSWEEHRTETDTESGCQDSDVKMEQEEHEKVAQDSSGLTAEEQGANKEANSKDAAGLEETKPEMKQGGTGTVGKRRRTDPTDPSMPSDESPAKRTAHIGLQSRQARAPLGLDSHNLQPEAESSLSPCLQGEGSQSSAVSGVGSTSEVGNAGSCAEMEGRSMAARHPIQEPSRLLPSVHLAEQPDPFSRYPIRGRLRRPTTPVPDPKEPQALEDVPRTKRQRRGEDPDHRVAVAADVGSGPSSSMGLTWPGDAVVAGACNEPAPGNSGGAQSRFIPQARPSIEVRTVSAAEAEQREGGSAYVLEPGWPHGMQMLAHVPVMRVRTVFVPGGGEAAYYASAFASAESVIGNMRSAPRSTFRFEELGELSLTDRVKERPAQRGTMADFLDDHPERSCEPDGTREGRECESSAQGDSGNLSPSRVARLGELHKQQAKEREEEPLDEASSVSADDDEEEEEDGEITSLFDVRAGAMPPCPGSGKTIDDDGVKMTLGKGGLVAEETGSKGLLAHDVHHSSQSNTTDDSYNATKATDVEEMEVSSDGGSYCGFEVAEAASPCISDDEDDVRWGRSDDRGDANGTTSALPPSPSSQVDTTANLQERLTELADCVEGSKSAADTVSKDTSPADDPSIGSAATAEQALRDTCKDGNTSRHRQEGSMVERDPEITLKPPPAPQQTGVTLALRAIVREQLQGVLRSASKGEEAALANGNGDEVIEKIATGAEKELFGRLYKDSTGGREYKAKYKQLLLSLGNVRNYRLVASVLAGNTTPVHLATKDAVGLLNSLSSSLNCLAIPLAGRHRQNFQSSSPAGNGRKGSGKHRGRMVLL